MMSEPSNLTQLGFVPKTSPVIYPEPVSNLITPAEQKLKLVERGQWLTMMAAQCGNDLEAKAGFERDAETLRKLYKDTLSEAVIQQRCERLAQVRDKLGLRVVDNRASYSAQTTRAVEALCGGVA